MRPKIMLLVAAIVAVLPHPATAAGSVELYEVRRSGSTLTVTGASTFVAQPTVPLGADPLDDAPTGFKDLGGDLTSVGMHATPSGDVVGSVGFSNVRLVYSTPVITYGWRFCVGGTDCYELQTQRLTFGTQNTLPSAPHSVLYRCATPACDPSSLMRVETGSITTLFHPSMYTVVLPAVVDAEPGTTITASQSAQTVFSALGTAEPMTVQRDTGDTLATMGAYTVPGKEIALAVGPRGQDPAAGNYGTATGPDADGMWAATVDVSELRGPHTVYVRSCLGAGNCAYATYDITL